MGNTFRGKCVADGIRVAVVAASFNELVVSQLVEGAEDALERFSMSECDMDTYWVPGCFEIPQTVSWLLEQGSYDGVLALGCLIRGETDHYDYLATEVTRGLGSLSTVSEIPVCYGILTCDNLEQALHRAGSKSGNKGAESMQALIEMINLTAVIGGEVEDVVEDGEEA
ncbi:6,7-dimethyl-8-ribityllumazine synthase [bacterium]|nr:6,7-dimethyl-8-ribityllumazine synthase [bacterium]